MAEKELKDTCNCEPVEEETDIVELEDEEGNLIKFHHITTLEHEGKDYVFLQAVENEEGDEIEIFELSSEEQDGEMFDLLNPIEDELYETLYARLMKEIEEFDGCDCGEEGCDCGEEGCTCHHE